MNYIEFVNNMTDVLFGNNDSSVKTAVRTKLYKYKDGDKYVLISEIQPYLSELIDKDDEFKKLKIRFNIRRKNKIR